MVRTAKSKWKQGKCSSEREVEDLHCHWFAVFWIYETSPAAFCRVSS